MKGIDNMSDDKAILCFATVLVIGIILLAITLWGEKVRRWRKLNINDLPKNYSIQKNDYGKYRWQNKCYGMVGQKYGHSSYYFLKNCIWNAIENDRWLEDVKKHTNWRNI